MSINRALIDDTKGHVRHGPTLSSDVETQDSQ
jgi:hypothetical protein